MLIDRNQIQPMTTADIDFAVELARAEDWTTSSKIFEAIIAHHPAGCLIAAYRGERIGTITTIPYKTSAWIGNLIVVPEHRRRGIGRQLMVLAIEHLQALGIETIRLEADPPGIPLYRSLGFRDEFESLRYRGLASTRASNKAVSDFKLADLSRVAAFDLELFGNDRSRFLAELYRQSEAAFLMESSSSINGYLLVLPTATGKQVGPFVACNPETAEQLLNAALFFCEGEEMSVGIPKLNQDGVKLLESKALVVKPSSVRMVLGTGCGLGQVTSIFGIANGATG